VIVAKSRSKKHVSGFKFKVSSCAETKNLKPLADTLHASRDTSDEDRSRVSAIAGEAVINKAG
jgi:hypothetical protein